MYIEQIREEIFKCAECNELIDIKLEDKYVNQQYVDIPALGKSYGVGTIPAKLMLIGLSPSYYRFLAAKNLHPFNFNTEIQDKIGSGKIMYKCMRKVGINLDTEVYVTNLCKCSSLRNKIYESETFDKCIRFLNQEIEFVKPKVIVLLGRDVMNYFKLDIGKISKRNDIMYISVYHPAYVAHQYGTLIRDYIKQWQAIEKLLKI